MQKNVALINDISDFKFFFPDITPLQLLQLTQLKSIYTEWNSVINVISRKDIDYLYERHVLHSMAIAKYVNFAPQTIILDIGTGGGFPGIPLAILYPNSHFTLADSIGKKITVAQAVADALQLSNVTAVHTRLEALPQGFDFAVSRAVASLPTLMDWAWSKIRAGNNSNIDNGMLCLKGGNLACELNDMATRCHIPLASISVQPINQWFIDSFFDEKKIIYIKKTDNKPLLHK